MISEVSHHEIHRDSLRAGNWKVVRDYGSRGRGVQTPTDRLYNLAEDGAEFTDAPALLSWTPRPDATAHELYFGADLAAVSAAGPGEPEHVGTLVDPEFPLALELSPGTRRYWRVDEVTSSGIVAGRVWRFAMTERIGDSLRVTESGTAEPELSWSDAGNGREYAIERCEPAVGESCIPAPLEVVGPYVSDWVDTGADGRRLLWYRVEETGACAP